MIALNSNNAGQPENDGEVHAAEALAKETQQRARKHLARRLRVAGLFVLVMTPLAGLSFAVLSQLVSPMIIALLVAVIVNCVTAWLWHATLLSSAQNRLWIPGVIGCAAMSVVLFILAFTRTLIYVASNDISSVMAIIVAAAIALIEPFGCFILGAASAATEAAAAPDEALIQRAREHLRTIQASSRRSRTWAAAKSEAQEEVDSLVALTPPTTPEIRQRDARISNAKTYLSLLNRFDPRPD